MPALVNYSGDDKYHKGGSLCSMDSSRSFSALDVYNRPSKRTRISDSHGLFANEEKNPSIEILPDECLYEIFRRLSSGQARSASACVSKHWLMLLSDVRSSEIVPNKVSSELSNGDELENDGYLTRSLEGEKATDTRLAAIAVGTCARGGLGKLSVRGSDKVTSIGFRTIARGCPSLRVLSLWNVPLIGDQALIEVSKECHLLESLDLSQCPSVSNAVLQKHWKREPSSCSPKLPKSTIYSIKDCPLIGDRGIATLLSSSLVLTKVKLQALAITDLSLAVIGRYGKSITNLSLTSLPNMTQKGFWAMGNAKGLKSLTSLTVVSCYGVTDMSLGAIGNGCQVLKHMTLKKCCFVSDNGLVSFTKAAHYLESLQLEECNRITQHGISGTLSNQSSKLKSFSLVKCMGINDLVQEPADFSESQSLRSLTIKNCIGFGNNNLRMLAKLCPHLHNLDLTGLSGINDAGLFEILETCKVGLVKVNLSDCINLTDKVVVSLAKIHGESLEMLNLDGCKNISDESLAAIAENCSFLKDLDVSMCCITDSGVFCLSKVGHMNLRVLSLSGCSRVSNESVLSLEKLGQTLVGLNLQGCNMISSSVIESLVVNLWRCDILS
ncbi:F-box domain, Leucine-rich repeat domain, L domain-like protein [Artemisia annua]|uniref:F-box domain, Leucine-rich repeat domain, L domain-like protein n=1 Tax=Artemisia annua TaxID=35608 RepID=A0A2U1N1N4_ARTAN|nr:F-box domain, Leucine-rich repeat domain, L domain-like protein [Artemisia annua]